MITFFIVFSSMAAFTASQKNLKVGIYENEPKIFTREGNPSGFWAELLNDIAAKEDWNIEWIHGTWDECLQRLEEGEIDIMPDVAFTNERSKKYDFQKETVFISWARVYVPKDSKIQSFPDLENKKIAVLKGSVNYIGEDGIKELTEKFGIKCSFVETKDYNSVFKSVEKKEVDAGVVNKNFGNKKESEYQIKRTAILFQPADLRFALSKKNPATASMIQKTDYHIKTLKNDRNSIYYYLIEKHFEEPIKRTIVFPSWVKFLICAIIVTLLFLTAASIVSRYQIKRKTAELKGSEEKYKTVFENTGTAMVILEEDKTISLANKKFEKLSGFPREEIEGRKKWTEFVVKEDLKKMRKYHNDRRKDPSAAPKKYEFKFVGREKEIKNIFLNVDTIPGTKKSVASLLDISERKKAEEKLRESEERYRTLFENSPEGILVAEIKNKRFLYANRSICNMLGYSKEELKQMSVSDIHPKDSLDNVISNFEAQARGEKKLAPLIPCLRKDGTIIYSDILTSKMNIEGRKCNVGFFTDKTDYKKAEEEKEKINLQLLQAQKMESVGRLAGTIAHDFNNLLTAIIGYGHLLYDEMDKEDPRSKMLEEILNAAKRAAGLTSQLLAFSRKTPLKLEVLDLNSVITDFIDMIDRLIGENILFSSNLEEGQINIKGDTTQIEQIILNLIVNARDSMPEGGKLTIKTKRVSISDRDVKKIPHSRKGNFISLSVKDTGKGMDKKTISKIFDPFYTTKKTGTGLGLSVVNEIIKKQNGWINVESKVGKGTTFKIYLPECEEKQEHKDITVIDLKNLQGKGESVLVIEDEKITRRFIAKVLNKNGYEVLQAASIEEAAEIMNRKEKGIQMLFSDIVLSDGSGLQFAEEYIKKNENLKVILSSGYTNGKAELSNIAKKKFKFLEKPYEVQDLLKKVKETFS